MHRSARCGLGAIVWRAVAHFVPSQTVASAVAVICTVQMASHLNGQIDGANLSTDQVLKCNLKRNLIYCTLHAKEQAANVAKAQSADQCCTLNTDTVASMIENTVNRAGTSVEWQRPVQLGQVRYVKQCKSLETSICKLATVAGL